MIKGVLFDLDGTLIDSAPSIIRCFEKTFRDLFPEVVLTEADKLSFLGPTLVQTFSRYTDDMDYVYKAFEYYVAESKREHDQNLIGAIPNAKEVLQKLKEKGYKIGVVTSKRNHMAKRGLDNNGLLEYVDILVGFDDVKNHKPAPDSLFKACELFNMNADELIYVGDHANDILAAQAAKMKSVAVEFSYNINQIKMYNPDYIIKDLLDILTIVKEK